MNDNGPVCAVLYGHVVDCALLYKSGCIQYRVGIELRNER